MTTKMRSLLYLGIIFLLPSIGFGIAFFWQADPSLEKPVPVTRGTLVDPAQSIAALGDEFLIDQWQLWTLVQPPCDTECYNKLAIVRDAHWALGKEAHRLIRTAIIIGEIDNVQSLQQAFPKMRIRNVQPQQAQSFFDSVMTVSSEKIMPTIAIDPLGNAFMYYDQNNTGNDIIIDLRKLLRYSPL